MIEMFIERSDTKIPKSIDQEAATGTGTGLLPGEGTEIAGIMKSTGVTAMNATTLEVTTEVKGDTIAREVESTLTALHPRWVGFAAFCNRVFLIRRLENYSWCSAFCTAN